MDIAPRGTFLLMPSYSRDIGLLGIKLVRVADAPEDGETVQATYFLLDAQTCTPVLLLAANYLTAIRTAATSAVATKLLARADARTLGIFGTGRQARAHISALRQVRKFDRILVCGSQPNRSRDFAKRLRSEINVEIAAVDPRTCAAESDVLCTCTTATIALFEGKWLRAGTHLNVVGAFKPHTREVDDLTVQRARVFVDTYEGAFSEAGDILIPLNAGLIARDHVLADLHELVGGKKQGRQDSNDITLFRSVGCALEDLVAANLLHTIQRAESSFANFS
jgi:ornithine cyclodeaminase